MTRIALAAHDAVQAAKAVLRTADVPAPVAALWTAADSATADGFAAKAAESVTGVLNNRRGH